MSLSSAPPALVAQLEGLGLSRNGALAYVTLLEDDGGDGLTGYEVAARSGIPRSAVYTVLRRLESRGAAFLVGADPARFVATAPGRWVGQVRTATLARLNEAEAALAALPPRERPEPVWVLRHYREVLARLERMILAAEHSVWLSLWPRELDALRPALEAISERSLHCVLHSPVPLPLPPVGFACWADTADSRRGKAGWAHKAVLVVDRREALIGGSEPDADNHAVWTTNPSLVDMATNHIVLDLTLLAQARGEDCTAVVAPMMQPGPAL